jgi:hypothetical protein
MPAPPPALYAENVLEDAILTLEPDGAVAGKGVERLDDRDIGLECEDSDVTGTRTWHADRGVGATTPTVHVWIFAGAAYAGEEITLETSPDNSVWTEQASVTPVDDSPQRVVFDTPFAVPRYVRWSVTDPDAPVRFTEVFVSPSVELTWKPSIGALREPLIPNVTLVESASGRAWAVKRGARRWSTTYLMLGSPNSDRQTIYDVLDVIADGAKPFWLWTVQSELRWVRMSGAVPFDAADRGPSGEVDITLSFVEELP